MTRTDLLALTDDGLVQLSNAGLVKRGLRDIAEGKAPALKNDADGAIEALFSDGTRTRLPPGRTLADASCSCPSSGICRHRVGLVLAYRHQNLAHARAGTPDWDPGTLDLAALEAALAPPSRAELARLRAAPIHARLSRGATPAAAMPMATVRFLTPNDPAYARCDCAAARGCVHIVLAVQAFRAAKGEAEATLSPVSDRTTGAAAPATAAHLRDATDAVLVRLLSEGVTAGLAAHAMPIDHARRSAEAGGATWLVLALEALAAQIGAYEQRSALHDEAEVLRIATELYARPRASAAAMGFGEAMETAMAKTRLVSIGARIDGCGVGGAASRQQNDARGETLARVALFDTDTGSTMLVEKVFSPPAPASRVDPSTVATRHIAPGLSLRAMARGQILTSVARRRADGTVSFGSGAGGKTTLMARGVLIKPPEPLLATRADALRAELLARPPRFLQPRNRGAGLHVFDIESVLGQALEPGAQIWRAAVTLANGGGDLNLQRRWDGAAPAALDVLGEALAGGSGVVRQICGQVWLEDGELVCDPWSLSTDTLIVPDVDGGSAIARVDAATPFETAAGPAAAVRFLAGALHAGGRRRDAAFLKQGRDLARQLDGAGFQTTARRLEQWLAGPAAGPEPFGQLAAWLAVLLEN